MLFASTVLRCAHEILHESIELGVVENAELPTPLKRRRASAEPLEGVRPGIGKSEGSSCTNSREGPHERVSDVHRPKGRVPEHDAVYELLPVGLVDPDDGSNLPRDVFVPLSGLLHHAFAPPRAGQRTVNIDRTIPANLGQPTEPAKDSANARVDFLGDPGLSCHSTRSRSVRHHLEGFRRSQRGRPTREAPLLTFSRVTYAQNVERHASAGVSADQAVYRVHSVSAGGSLNSLSVKGMRHRGNVFGAHRGEVRHPVKERRRSREPVEGTPFGRRSPSRAGASPGTSYSPCP